MQEQSFLVCKCVCYNYFNALNLVDKYIFNECLIIQKINTVRVKPKWVVLHNVEILKKCLLTGTFIAGNLLVLILQSFNQLF